MILSRASFKQTKFTTSQIQIAKTPLASFESNVSGLYIPEILAYIQATQSGSGDPSPINPMAINGVSSVDTTRTGKNLFDYSDSGIILSGFSNNNGVFTNNNTDTRTLFYPALQLMNGSTITDTITMSGKVGRNTATFTIADTITKLRIKHNGASRDLRIDYPFTQKGTFTLSMTVTANNPSVVGGLSFKDVQLELGNTATPYEAYTGTTATTDLGGTYYGGYVNVPTGLLTVDRVKTLLKDFPNQWRKLPSGTGAFYISRSLFPYAIDYNNRESTQSNTYKYSASGTQTNYSIRISDALYIVDDRWADAAELQDYIDNNDVYIVYPLKTPFTIQLTPQQIEQLLGENNVFCSTGDVEVDYWHIN